MNPPPRFTPGTTAVRRHVRQGEVWTAVPYRVLQDTDDYLVVAGWPSLRGLLSTTLIDTITNGDAADRKHPIRELASGAWELARWSPSPTCPARCGRTRTTTSTPDGWG
ncbi:hypothetical protein GCM10009850_091550 [Nonomuraea monospora]|uniref:Uncharacterized protein n=1 Tax=Nonomuraea monospora TaxID=568818 RepID=A0ABP5PPU3_9ACTN